MKFRTSFLILVVNLGTAITVHAQLVNGAVYKIKNVTSGRYAQTANNSYENEAPIHLYDNQDANNFKWKALYVKGGYYKFQNINSNKCLAVTGASRNLYGKICQVDDSYRQATTWKLEKITNGYRLKNVNSKLFMGVEGGGKENGALLVQWSDDGAQDKIWQFEKLNTAASDVPGKKVLVDVVLNYIAISEATRSRPDNGDCKRVFGCIQTELWEMDGNNEMKTQLASHNNMPELLFDQRNFQSPPLIGLNYQFHMEYADNNELGKVTYNIPEDLLMRKKVMLVVKTNLGTRHKDNDFATYDCLKMEAEKLSTFILRSDGKISETIQVNTDQASSRRDMHVQDYIIPFAVFQGTDDTHKLWVKISTKKN
ncbi:MAG: RICIN domain-containing protein [Chitinophagaceae bacterium]|nr:RICIN domain-containing protein [Chitinophagaceae bacterium]